MKYFNFFYPSCAEILFALNKFDILLSTLQYLLRLCLLHGNVCHSVIPGYPAIRNMSFGKISFAEKKICFFQNMLWKTHHYVGLLAVSCLNYYYMFCLQEACTVWYAGCNTRGSILSAINGLGALLYRLRFICESVYLVSLDAMFYWYSIIHCTYPT